MMSGNFLYDMSAFVCLGLGLFFVWLGLGFRSDWPTFIGITFITFALAGGCNVLT